MSDEWVDLRTFPARFPRVYIADGNLHTGNGKGVLRGHYVEVASLADADVVILSSSTPIAYLEAGTAVADGKAVECLDCIPNAVVAWIRRRCKNRAAWLVSSL